MCRFAAYHGENPMLMADLMTSSKNALIYQRDMEQAGEPDIMNADGFGMGWYDHNIDELPAVYRSIQPVWNDQNLAHIANKIQSNTLVGHIRAATVGDINSANCHPFFHKDLMMVHNGSIHGIHLFKKAFVAHMSDDSFNHIKGNTDTEYLFHTISSQLNQLEKAQSNGKDLVKVIRDVFSFIASLDQEHDTYSRINIILTNGRQMLATRWSSKPNDDVLKMYFKPSQDGVIIASEHLDDSDDWEILPRQHILLVSQQYKYSLTQVHA
ncbi:MAG: class II glutamine amidotransferase [Candidatus Comchoanobacterales bacterium]